MGGVGEARKGLGWPVGAVPERDERRPVLGDATMRLSGDGQVGGATREDVGKLMDSSGGEKRG